MLINEVEMSWIIFYDPKALKPNIYKYLKANGKWHIFDIMYSHKEVADEISGKTEAAGFIGVFENFVRFDNPWSSTLQIGTTEEQEHEMATLVGLPHRDRY